MFTRSADRDRPRLGSDDPRLLPGPGAGLPAARSYWGQANASDQSSALFRSFGWHFAGPGYRACLSSRKHPREGQVTRGRRRREIMHPPGRPVFWPAGCRIAPRPGWLPGACCGLFPVDLLPVHRVFVNRAELHIRAVKRCQHAGFFTMFAPENFQERSPFCRWWCHGRFSCFFVHPDPIYIGPAGMVTAISRQDRWDNRGVRPAKGAHEKKSRQIPRETAQGRPGVLIRLPSASGGCRRTPRISLLPS